MDSLVSDASRRRERNPHDSLEVVVGSDAEGQIPDPAPNAEDVRAAREAVDMAQRLFQDDSEALAILQCCLQGMTPSEIQARLSMSQRAFETVQRRIGRRIRKHFPEGWRP